MATQTARLVHDSRFEAFRQDDFDAAQFTSRALSDTLSSAHTKGTQLREDIKTLESGIREAVIARQPELHSVVTRLAEMESACESVDKTVVQLGASVGELRSSLEGPCRRLRNRTTQLKNLRATIETLRGVSRRLKLLQKLKRRIGDAGEELEGVDLPEVARILADLHDSSGADVSGIHVLEEDGQYVESMKQRVRLIAESKLLKGQESHNQADMGHALHVYFNLNALPAAVEMLTSKKVTRLSQKARNAFDFHKLTSGSRTPGQGTFQESVWNSLRTLISEVEEDVTGVYYLQQVLAKKHDPVTHICFLSVVPEGSALVNRFWTQSVGILERSMAHAVQSGKSTPVREVLVHGFPKLCSFLEEAVERLSKRCLEKGKPTVFGSVQLQELLGSCLSVQNVFSARSLTHMSDAILGVFPASSRSIPPSTEMQKLISVFHEEMKQAEKSVHTCCLVANNVANASCSISEKVQMLAASGSELRTLASSCNAAQLRNISLCSSLQEIHKSLVSLIGKLDQRGAEFLIPACDMLRATAMDFISPIFKACVESLEQKLQEMHTLTTWNAAEGPDEASGYLKALRSQLRAFSMEYLARFTPPFSPVAPSFVRSLVKRLTCRMIVFFVRHAALIRPLTPYGRQQFVRDALELENILSQTLLPVSTLTQQSNTLHAFRELIQADPDEIRSRPVVMELPRSVILHHLFSRGSSELKLPHELIGLTPSQFSFWLDQHSTEEAILRVQSALEASPSVEGDEKIRAVLSDLCRR